MGEADSIAIKGRTGGGYTKITEKHKERFIESLKDFGNVRVACDYAVIKRRSAFRLKEQDEEFRQQWEDALEEYADRLEVEADRRASQGVMRKKFYQGTVIIDPDTEKAYEEREFSDNLLMFRLKALRPDKYRENVKYEFGELTDKEIVARAALVAERIRALVGGNGQARDAITATEVRALPVPNTVELSD